MNIKDAFISAFSNWLNFTGRACRSEYWYFFLSIALITIVLTFLETSLGLYSYEIEMGPLTFLFTLIVIIPWISVTSRRLQDRGLSGWWQLLYLTFIFTFVILILLMLPAKEDENKWGKNPLLDL